MANPVCQGAFSFIFAAMLYTLLRSILFAFDPEWVHYFSMNQLSRLCRWKPTKAMVLRWFGAAGFGASANLSRQLFGLHFPNPVGLGAGFDKNAVYLNELEALGFGFVEVGTVTPLPQAGNDKPRLFRLPKDGALINRMGFNNDGAAVVAGRLRQWRSTHKGQLIVGGNIGKNKATSNELAWQDYEKCFLALHPYVDYFVVNVSSPNTPGLRELQEKPALHKILTHLQTLNREQSVQRPILLKIAPDLSSDQVKDVVSLAVDIQLDGLVCSNTTISREHLQTPTTRLTAIGAGGLSGKPLRERANALTAEVARLTQGRMPIIGSGGIFTGDDARERVDAGAVLVQVWTGFIYQGPGIVQKICKKLTDKG
jgi:dihydroorotate dehydrogenase